MNEWASFLQWLGEGASAKSAIGTLCVFQSGHSWAFRCTFCTKLVRFLSTLSVSVSPGSKLLTGY